MAEEPPAKKRLGRPPLPKTEKKRLRGVHFSDEEVEKMERLAGNEGLPGWRSWLHWIIKKARG